MELRIGYGEVEGLIAKAVDRRIWLRYCADDEVEVLTNVKMLFVEKTVGVNLKVEKIDGSDVICSYSGGFGVSALLKGALTFLKGYFPEVVEMIDMNDDGRLVLHLAKMKQLQKALDVITIKGLSFSPESIIVSFNMK